MLRLYPVASIKKNFKTTKKKHFELLDEIITSSKADDILNFAFTNAGRTKQHLFLFNNPVGYDKAKKHTFYPQFLKNTKESNGVFISNYMFRQTYTISAVIRASGVFQNLNLDFYQPVSVEITKEYLLLRLTKLEKNPKSYLPAYEVFTYKRKKEDEDVMKEFINHINTTLGCSIYALDLNRGVKKLWEDDLIDAMYVRYKDTTSTVSVSMDEDYTYKDQNPEGYKIAMGAPLMKHIFRFLKDNTNKYCDFYTDPTEGIIAFNKYPNDINQINNVVSEILKNN
jgi:hypothetical protein